MNVNKYTKAELVQIIGWVETYGGTSYVRRAVSAVETQRQQRAFSKADRLLDERFKKIKERLGLFSPYVGMRYTDIPAHVIEKAAQLEKEIIELDEKWHKLMDE